MDLTQKDWLSSHENDNNSVIVDVRTSEEYLEGHIQNSILIDITKTKSMQPQNPQNSTPISNFSGIPAPPPIPKNLFDDLENEDEKVKVKNESEKSDEVDEKNSFLWQL